MSLEDLEKELYSFKKSKGGKFNRKSVLGTSKPELSPESAVPESWSAVDAAPSQKKKRFSFFSFIVIGSIAVIIFGIIMILQYLNSSELQIGLEAILPPSVEQGVPFEAIVKINNRSDQVLRNAFLNISLPAGIVWVNGLKAGEIRESLGDIGIGGISKRTFSLLATEDGGGVRKLNFNLIYEIASGERFEQKFNRELIIQKSAIQLSGQAPERILSGSPFDILVSYENLSNFDLENLFLEVFYPPDFKFISSDLAPDSLSNNRWTLGELKSRSRGSIKIRGSVTAPPQSFLSLPVILKSVIAGQEYVISRADIGFSISPSPLVLSVIVNNNPAYVARIGDRLTYVVNYQNNSGAALADVILRVKLTGELFDPISFQTNANIDSLNRVLTWNASHVPDFRLLPPGASGAVSFDVRLLPNFPIKRLNDKNYLLKAEATMDSPTVPSYLETDKTSAVAINETKVSGSVSVDARAFFRDAASGILNLGAMPPKVNQPTQYTIHWRLVSAATDVKEVTVRAFLQSGVTWTGPVKSNIDSVPLYNERTQEIIWKIDKLVANKGIIGEPVEAIFQIQAVPNINQIGQYQPLLSETRIEAVDEFTGLQLENFDTALTTSLPDDLTVGQGTGRVVQ